MTLSLVLLRGKFRLAEISQVFKFSEILQKFSELTREFFGWDFSEKNFFSSESPDLLPRVVVEAF